MTALPRDAVRWVFAYTLAVLGDVGYYLILTWAAAEAGGQAWSGLILAAGSVPRAVLLIAGGILADRVDPRRIAIWTDTARALTLAAAAVLAGTLGLLPAWLLVVAVLFGIVDACFMPAVGAMPPRLVPSDQLVRVQAWRITGLRVANTAGPAMGAALLSFGPVVAFAVPALLFAASVLLLRGIRPRPTVTAAEPTATPGWRQVRELRLTALVLGTALSELPFAGPVAAAIVLLVQDRGWSAAIAGAVLAAFSVGGLAASLLLSVVTRPLGRASVLSSVAVTVVLLTLLGGAGSEMLTVAVGAALGLSSGVTMVLCQGQVQRSTPQEMLGRVTAVLTLLTLGLSPLAYTAIGLIAGTVGLTPFFLAAAAVVAVAGVMLTRVTFGAPVVRTGSPRE